MRLLRLVVAASLFAGSPAAAQVAGTVRLAPSLSAPAPVLAPGAAPALLGGTAPALLAPSLAVPSIAAAPAPVPVPARVAAMAVAVAAAVPADLGKASPGAARSSSDAAFAALTGNSPPRRLPRSSPRRFRPRTYGFRRPPRSPLAPRPPARASTCSRSRSLRP
ncbi:MAG: hypothetical protein M0D55_02160 [Elusimicrobiota bacterium]|nr:MAG: hypothetical protein M0D55_02160 [Elusimicrobiota bacterium]